MQGRGILFRGFSVVDLCRGGGFWQEVGIFAEAGKFSSEELLQGLGNFPDTMSDINVSIIPLY
jgi:hypothetical protein